MGRCSSGVLLRRSSSEQFTRGEPGTHTCFALSALCSSINLLDARPPSAAAAGDGHVTRRCCLSVTAYVAAVPLAANSSSTAQHAPGSIAGALAASFRTCKNSTGSGCIASLLTGTSSSTGMYRVPALLLPAQAGQQTADSSAHGTNSSQEVPPPAGGDAPSSPAASIHTTAAAAPAQHSGVHDMLLTVHAEQEVAGQVYLVVSSQLVRAGRRWPANTSAVCLQQQSQKSKARTSVLTAVVLHHASDPCFLLDPAAAGTGVVKAAVNMSHYSHSWASPAAPSPAPPQLTNFIPPPPTNSAHQDTPQQEPANESDTLTDQAQGNSTRRTDAWPAADCACMHAHAPAQDGPAPISPPAPAEGAPAAATDSVPPAAAAEGFLSFLPASLQVQLALSEPAALAQYLQSVLGYGMQDDRTGSQHSMQRSSCTVSSASSCTCPALPDAADQTAAEAWTAAMQAALFTCPRDTSLHSCLGPAAAVAQHGAVHWQPAAGLGNFLASTAADIPAVAAVLDWLATSGLPVVATATPQQLLAGLVAAALSLLALLLTAGCRPSKKAHAATAAVQQQQQYDMGRVQANPPADCESGVCPAGSLQQQMLGLSHDATLEEHMEDMDADMFGYGAPPPAAPAHSSQRGSGMLAAAQGIRRASAMAAGEAAGALKDAFMRRQTNQQVPKPAGSSGGAGSTAPPDAAAGTANAADGAERDWLEEDDEERVNAAPESIQRQLQAGGRWRRDGEGRLVRGSWKAVRNSLSAAAQAVLAAVGAGGQAVAAAGGLGQAAAAAAGEGAVAPEGAGGWEEGRDADALQQLLSAAPSAVVSFTAN